MRVPLSISLFETSVQKANRQFMPREKSDAGQISNEKGAKRIYLAKAFIFKSLRCFDHALAASYNNTARLKQTNVLSPVSIESKLQFFKWDFQRKFSKSHFLKSPSDI